MSTESARSFNVQRYFGILSLIIFLDIVAMMFLAEPLSQTALYEGDRVIDVVKSLCYVYLPIAVLFEAAVLLLVLDGIRILRSHEQVEEEVDCPIPVLEEEVDPPPSIMDMEIATPRL